MSKLEDTFKKIAQENALRPAEKAAMRSALVARMGVAAPAAAAPQRSFSRRSVASPYSARFFLMRVPALLAVFLIVGGSVSYAAEGALPGDPLYTIKVKVNEPVQSVLAFSTEAKADWEMSRAERRLGEAEKLAADNRLTPETAHDLQVRFTASTESASEHISQLEREDPSKAAVAASKLATSIEVHQTILAQVAPGEHEELVSEVGRQSETLAQDAQNRSGSARAATLSIAAKSAPAEDAAAEASGDGNTTLRSMAFKKAAVEALSTASSTFVSLRPTLSDETALEISAAIDSAAALVARGDASYLADAESKDALDDYREALSRAQKVTVSLKAGASIGIKLLPSIFPVIQPAPPEEPRLKDEEAARGDESRGGGDTTPAATVGGTATSSSGASDIPVPGVSL